MKYTRHLSCALVLAVCSQLSGCIGDDLASGGGAAGGGMDGTGIILTTISGLLIVGLGGGAGSGGGSPDVFPQDDGSADGGFADGSTDGFTDGGGTDGTTDGGGTDGTTDGGGTDGTTDGGPGLCDFLPTSDTGQISADGFAFDNSALCGIFIGDFIDESLTGSFFLPAEIQGLEGQILVGNVVTQDGSLAVVLEQINTTTFRIPDALSEDQAALLRSNLQTGDLYGRIETNAGVLLFPLSL